MLSKKQTATEISQNLAIQLDWQTAERDDKAVAQLLYAGEKADEIHTLDEAGLLDGFFAFLSESEVMSVWKAYEISGLQRIFLPTILFLLLYGMRILFGINSMNALPSLLFSNIPVMLVIGFNARLITSGKSRRGEKVRKADSKFALMDPQTVAETVCKSSLQELEKLFNQTIHALAKYGIFMAEMMVALDGTRIITTEEFSGRGCQAVSEWKRNRQGLKVEVIEFVYGWRLIVLIDLMTLMPIALKIVQIQAHEAPHLVELVKQAQANLAPYSRIKTLVIDRAYVDGKSLYQLDQMGIGFVVIAKTNMAAYGTALCKSVESPRYYERTATVFRGQGRDRAAETLLTQLQTATAIRTWDSYRPPVVKGQHLRIADRPALNAVIVRIWNNKKVDNPRIFLTNLSVDDPWLIFNLYDDRSWIENGLFRNSKQFWHLVGWFPKKTQAGVQTHLTFVMLITALATAFRLWDKAQSTAVTSLAPPQPNYSFTIVHCSPDNAHPDALVDHSRPAPGETESEPPLSSTHLAATLLPHDQLLPYSHHFLLGIGPSRWRQELKRENRDKVIVFFGNTYGIFDLPVFLVLTGVPFQIPSAYASVNDILAQYAIRRE
jgi:hypothetical protein